MTPSARPEVAAWAVAWRRRVLGALIVALVVGGVAGAVYVLRSATPPGPSQQPSASGQTPSVSVLLRYDSPLGWSIRFPPGMHVEHSAAGGISFGVDEATFASFHSRHGVQRHQTPRMESIREVPPRGRLGHFPAHGIAVRVLWLFSLGGVPAGTTRLPLRLPSFRDPGPDWYSGTHPRPLQHVLVANPATVLRPGMDRP
jgi:hypothetical protein